jgi:hypothetical protein
MQFLKNKGAIPQDGRRFVEKWRRDATKNAKLLKRAWTRIESQGKVGDWLEGVTTEDEWASLLYSIMRWQRQYEEERGVITHAIYSPL